MQRVSLQVVVILRTRVCWRLWRQILYSLCLRLPIRKGKQTSKLTIIDLHSCLLRILLDEGKVLLSCDWGLLEIWHEGPFLSSYKSTQRMGSDVVMIMKASFKMLRKLKCYFFSYCFELIRSGILVFFTRSPGRSAWCLIQMAQDLFFVFLFVLVFFLFGSERWQKQATSQLKETVVLAS